jgi:menaquinone-specific isochorismate synthase
MTGFEDRGHPLVGEALEAGGLAPETADAARVRPTARGIVSLPLRRGYDALAGMVMAALAGPADDAPRRLSVAVPGVDPLAWLAAQGDTPALYWRDRDGQARVAGAGIADRLALGDPAATGDLLEQAARRLRHAPPEARYYGGFRFDAQAARGGDWRDFGLGWLVMPRFEIAETAAETHLVCTVFPGRDRAEAVLADLRRLSDAPRRPLAPPLARRHADAPDVAGWADAVAAVTGGIRQGAAWRKVVLARRTSLRGVAPVEPLGMLQGLAAATPRCFHFYFNPTGHCAFLGASPEQLFHREGDRVTSEALAGTRPRGSDIESDAALEAELRASGKDGREHGFVDAHVRAALEGVTKGVETDGAVSVLKLASVQHLLRRMHGRLKPGCGDAALMDALHPTPAVCGEPPEAAVAQIRALEPFDRGWYAGPVGFVGRDETRFAVGIRSALVCGDEVALFTGAGVVEGSDSTAEWQELEAKLRGIWTGRTL